MVGGLSAFVAVVLAATLAAAPAQPSVLFTVRDPRIGEASGIARGITSPGVYYVQNDSGDTARFFAIDARSGAVRAVYRVPGAVNHDWEDLSVAHDPSGRSWLWLADIGDNLGTRREVQVYRVPEPHVDMRATDRFASTSRPQVWRLRYPSGAPDAESFAVAPDGRAYVFTKTHMPRSAAYELPVDPDPRRVQVLRRIGSFAVPVRDPVSLLPARLQRMTTGAAISADGRLLVVRTYLAAYLWRIGRGGVEAALRESPTAVRLPLQRQGEGVCLDGSRMVLDSEGRTDPVWSVPLPAALQGRPAPSHSPSRAGSPAPTPSRHATSTPARHVSGHGRPLGVLVLVVAAAIAGAGAWRARRGRRQRE